MSLTSITKIIVSILFTVLSRKMLEKETQCMCGSLQSS